MSDSADEFGAFLDEVATPVPLPSNEPAKILDPEPVPPPPGTLALFGEQEVPSRPMLMDRMTGEVIATPELAAMYLDRLRELKRDVLARGIREAEAYLISYMDEQGAYTLHLPGGVKATGDTAAAAERVTWDLEQLEDDLRGTGLPEDRINELIKTTVSRRIDHTEAKRIAASSPERAAALEAAQKRSPGDRHVKVEEDHTGRRRPE